ncbi:MAG TPA: polysaccharide biosynthesis/export family protein, partial [Rhodothermales bacterium]|nr:polysaccharide biosynthesis/export family protein [Rhodothermales bacterium]
MRLHLLRVAAQAALLLFLVSPAGAQDSDADRLPAALRPRGGATTTPGVPVPLEGPVDARTYRVGPGDVFSVTVGGPVPVQALAPVTADGQVLLPTAGAVPVAGLTLEAARERIMSALRPYFRTGIDAALATPRTFYVHVSGAVPMPGRLPVGPVARLEDALALSFPATPSAADTLRTLPRLGTAPALRSVRVTHLDGT